MIIYIYHFIHLFRDLQINESKIIPPEFRFGACRKGFLILYIIIHI